ncbi:MAG: alpha/beta hydrolase [Mangrovibacterium sp.]
MRKQFLAPALLFGFIILYLCGPCPPKPKLTDELPHLNRRDQGIESFVCGHDNGMNVKANNEAKISWADSTHRLTSWCLLYLHGFSASRMEGMPTHENVANYFDMNLYMPRLASHGIETDEPLLNMTPDLLYDSAKEALVMAHKLGQKVIIMGTSTGGTLALKLAADFPNLVDGLILYSPNVEINNFGASMLSKPWGLQIARLIYGGKYRTVNPDPSDDECLYWNCFYRLEATVYLQQLIDACMNKATFSKVKCPTFLGYYYKDEEHQDPVVNVSAALKMFDEIQTDESHKEKQAFDAGVHIIAYGKDSKTQPEVEQATIDFIQKQLMIK